ncbi:MAG: hypothetical protein ACRD8A_18120 [Candidatus Acidiferrales bacterium]
MPLRNATLRTLLATAAACASIGIAGCPHRTIYDLTPPAPTPRPQMERPMNIAPDTDATPPHAAAPAPPHVAADDTPPPLSADLPIMKMPGVPPRPPTEKTAEHEPEPVDHAPAPQIVPQLSASEQQNYQRQASNDANVAQQNLAQAAARQLNPQQRDLRDKVRSYLKQSEDAGKAGDWLAAQNLAQKARQVSVQLLNSL